MVAGRNRAMKEDELDILEEFVQESREHLAAIEPDLLAMERQGSSVSSEIVNRVFRAIHSTKGGAAFLGFELLKRFSHTMESVLGLIRDGKLEITAPVADALLRGIDVLRRMVDDIRASDQTPCAEELKALEAILSGGSAQVGAPPGMPTVGVVPAAVNLIPVTGEKPTKPGLVDPVTPQLVPALTPAELEQARREASAHGMQSYRVDVAIQSELAAAGLSPEKLVGAIKGVGRCVEGHIEGNASGPLGRVLLEVHSVLESSLLATALGIPERCVTKQGAAKAGILPPVVAVGERATASRVASGPTTFPGDPTPRDDASAAGPSGGPSSVAGGVSREGAGQRLRNEPAAEANETLRVRVDLLNRLMNSASELVLGRNQLLRTLKDSGEKTTGLGIILQHIDRVTSELQEGIMQTRMQPVGTLFGRFSRVARDLGRQLGKQVELQTEGNHVELDKSIIEALVDPLTHIVRNSVDHGVELPDERVRRGKPASGRILLTACHESGQVNIVVSDDGRGIDRGAVLRKALERGLISAMAAENATERDVVNLLMAPGFSTAEKISDVSGRGVGMDVVRTNVESLGGQIEIDSELGRGTTVRLRLPLTLAIIPSLIVGSGDARFAVPQASIVELVWVRSGEEGNRIKQIHGVQMLRLRGHLVPLVRLEEVLGITEDQRPKDSSSCKQHREQHVLLLKTGADRYGLVVDELFESEEIVVKPLPHFLKGIECFVGTTILGDGSVTMILDPGGIATRAQLNFASAEVEEESGQQAAVQTNSRSVILFAASPGEQFAVGQEQVLRLERIQRCDLRQSGGHDYISYRGSGLRVLRIDRHLPVGGVPDDATELFLLIPRAGKGQRAGEPPGGILVWRIIDALDVAVEVRPALFSGPGVRGMAMIDDVLTTFIDPLALLSAEGLAKENAA
jgi:two-component system, chemotaxis family, sensor kinase CheA